MMNEHQWLRCTGGLNIGAHEENDTDHPRFRMILLVGGRMFQEAAVVPLRPSTAKRKARRLPLSAEGDLPDFRDDPTGNLARAARESLEYYAKAPSGAHHVPHGGGAFHGARHEGIASGFPEVVETQRSPRRDRKRVRGNLYAPQGLGTPSLGTCFLPATTTGSPRGSPGRARRPLPHPPQARRLRRRPAGSIWDNTENERGVGRLENERAGPQFHTRGDRRGGVLKTGGWRSPGSRNPSKSSSSTSRARE